MMLLTFKQSAPHNYKLLRTSLASDIWR